MKKFELFINKDILQIQLFMPHNNFTAFILSGRSIDHRRAYDLRL